ncbi:MAG: hypothetical protein ACOY0T_33765 [Myxococcota bacterium]
MRLSRWVVLLFATTLCPALHAAETAAAVAPEESAPLAVSVTFVDMGEASDLDAKIASWFVRQGASYRSVRLAHLDASELVGEHAPGLHVFVTRPQAEMLRIFFVMRDDGTRRYLVRDISLPRGLDEIGLENSAQVVFAASMALWEGSDETSLEHFTAALEGPKQSAPPSPPAPPGREAARFVTRAPVTPRERARDSVPYLVTSAGYALRVQESQRIAQGPTLALGIADRALGLREAGVRASATFLLPDTLGDSYLELELRGYSFGLEPWAEIWHRGSLRLLASVTSGFDVVRATPRARSTEASVSAASRTLDPIVAPRLTGYFDVGNLSIGAALDLSVALVRRHYDVMVGEERRRWLDPWIAQPGLSIYAAWSGRQ